MATEAMSETVQQIEQAIKSQWHIMGRYRTPLGGPSYEYPVALEGDSVILRDGDCGLAKPTRTITVAEWEQLAKSGMWRHVGIWSFVRADDPASDAIAYCYRNPASAGRELHQLRESVNAVSVREASE